MRALFVLLLLATPALAQQAVNPSVQTATPGTEAARDSRAGEGTQGPAAGDPSVQSAAPEVGSGRGGADAGSGGNTTQPTTTEPQRPTGSERPAQPTAVAPQPTRPPAAPILPSPPMAARDNFSASELELQRTLQGGVIGGRVSIPDQAAGILIQPQGRDWRQFRTRVLTITGIVAVIGTVFALGLFYALRGQTRIGAGRSGRRIQRFTLFERANHWMVSFSFIALALTGLNITYGVYILHPVIGPTAFTTLTLWGQAAHQFLAFAFMAGLLVMMVVWARQNLIGRIDIDWLRAGGPLAKSHPPAGKFNLGQKALYWLTMLGGIALSVSGILLMLPGLLDNVVSQQWAHIAHGMVSMGMIAMILGHIYIGSVGMEGALEAMRDGEVDYNWAREHHSAWLEQEVAAARDRIAPQGRTAGAD